MKNTSFLLFFLFAAQNLLAQEVYTEFTNPSFEDLARPQQPPYGWWDCGFAGETPPDVHPIPEGGAFGVNHAAHDGNTYLGMVVRANDTWESVGQRLSEPLKPKEDYMFTLFMCKSQKYLSRLKGNEDDVSFTTPILLRVWGGTGFCNKRELLAETELVNHTEWKEYSIRFSPSSKHSYIVLEAYYDDDFETPNGNIMLDNLSPIYLDNDYVPTPSDYLKRFIKDEDFYISFDKENELTEYSKDLLLSLKDKMKDVENIHLVFGVKGKKKSKRSEKIIHLNKFIEGLGIEETKLSVKEYGDYKQRFDWFFKKGDVHIGLIEID